MNKLVYKTPQQLFVQILIKAYDNAGAATKSSTGTLSVTINLNLNDPFFVTTSYSTEILEIQEVLVPFLSVDAQDGDVVVSVGLEVVVFF